MPSISPAKKDRISEQILHHLFTISPNSAFTVQIANEIARDEEFTLSLLNILHQKNLVIPISKNSSGTPYTRRKRWRLSNETYNAYKKHQEKINSSKLRIEY